MGLISRSQNHDADEEKQSGEQAEDGNANAKEQEAEQVHEPADGERVEAEATLKEGNEAAELEDADSEIEVVDDTPEQPQDLETVEFDDSQLATFTANFGEFSFKLIPESRSSGIRWVVAVYASGVQGSLFRTDKQITDAQADEFGLPERLQERLNEALRFSNEELTLPAELQSELKSKSLEDLERLKEMTEQEA
jgi:hypothetical protein